MVNHQWMGGELRTMKFYGYEPDSEKLSALEEVSIDCTIDELQMLIDFFTYVQERHSFVKDKTEMCHSHLKDWCDHNDYKSDLIIVTRFLNNHS